MLVIVSPGLAARIAACTRFNLVIVRNSWGANSEVPVEDIPQCTLGYARGTTQVVDTERFVSCGPYQVEDAAKYLGTICCPAPAVHIFPQRQQRAQSSISNLKLRSVLCCRLTKVLRTLRIYLKHAVDQTNQPGQWAARDFFNIAIQQLDIDLVRESRTTT